MIKQFTEKLRAENSVCIACLGDSVTHGYFASHDGMHSNTDYEAVYHNRLRQKINLYFSGKSVNIINAGVWSPYSLYSEEIATFGASDYNQADAAGFIQLYGLPIAVQAKVDGKSM